MLHTINCRKGTSQDSLFTILIVLFTLFHVYRLPSIPVSYGELLMIATIPLYFKRGMNLPTEGYEIGFVLFFCYMAISSIVLGIVFDAPMSKLISVLRAGLYWTIIFYFGKNLFNRKLFEKWMIVFSVALSIFILVQFFVYLLSGYYIPGLIYNLPISNGSESGLATYQSSLNIAKYFGYLRPHGFLAEPAHSSQVLIFCFTTLIYNREVSFQKKITLLILISAAILATQSTTGVILLIVAWLLFISFEKKLSIYRYSLVLLLIIAGFFILNTEKVSNFSSVERIANVVNGSEIDGSSNMRLNNGINLFSKLPFTYKIFGTGEGLLEYVASTFSFGMVQDYMNTCSRILFNTGTLGLLIWVISLVILFGKSGLFGKILVMEFFAMSLGCSIYCQPQMVWFFLLILADIKEKNDRYSCAKLQ